MSTNASKGRRYTFAEKRQIFEFVARFNSENGRGGKAAACRQFGVTNTTLNRWSEDIASALETPATTFGKKLARLHELNVKIVAVERNLRLWRTHYDVLKSLL